jgi:hypothetical protein
MAGVAGTPGRTSARIHTDRLLRRSSGWMWLLPTVGAGAAAMIWGMGGTATPAVTVASFVVATPGIFWMLATSVPAVRRAGGRAAEIVEFASAAADVARLRASATKTRCSGPVQPGSKRSHQFLTLFRTGSSCFTTSYSPSESGHCEIDHVVFGRAAINEMSTARPSHGTHVIK